MTVEQFAELLEAIETQTQCIQDLSTALTVLQSSVNTLQSTLNLFFGVVAGILTGVVFWNTAKGMS